jgi:hypothetical protein
VAYYYKADLLSEAGEDFSALARELGMLQERICTVLSQWQEGFPELKRNLTKVGECVLDASGKAGSLGLALYEIIDCYSHAERTAIQGHYNDLSMQMGISQSTGVPKIRSPSGMVLLDRTILPDWLQQAVLEYERSQ